MTSLNDSFFRRLGGEEEREFRAWARENYTPGTTINLLWHPVVRDECEKINRERGEPLNADGSRR